jgi:hypothetical protein
VLAELVSGIERPLHDALGLSEHLGNDSSETGL